VRESGSGKETPFLLRHFAAPKSKRAPFYQDRLGTNMG
jgi:hypothetical protein